MQEVNRLTYRIIVYLITMFKNVIHHVHSPSSVTVSTLLGVVDVVVVDGVLGDVVVDVVRIWGPKGGMSLNVTL